MTHLTWAAGAPGVVCYHCRRSIQFAEEALDAIRKVTSDFSLKCPACEGMIMVSHSSIARWKKKEEGRRVMRVLYLTVPPGKGNFDTVIKMFQASGCKVDDPGVVSTRGRDLQVWIPEHRLIERTLDSHVGYFIGEAPCDVCGEPGCNRKCTTEEE